MARAGLNNNCLKVHRVPGELSSGGSIWKDPHYTPSFPRGGGKWGEKHSGIPMFSNWFFFFFFSRTWCSCLLVSSRSWWGARRAFVVVAYPPFLSGFPSEGLLGGDCIATLQSLIHPELYMFWLKATHGCLKPSFTFLTSRGLGGRHLPT